jgi:hypothetical protein
MIYGIRNRDYLRRARQQLDEGTAQGITYAALELRSGIESRLAMYLAAQTESEDLRKHGWKVVAGGKELERRFKLGEKTIHVQVFRKHDNALIDDWFYTPVTRKLRRLHGQLANYLHASAHHRLLSDKELPQSREFMETVYDEFEKATRGNLMSVPLMNPENHQAQFTITPPDDDEEQNIRLAEITAGQTYVLRIDYVDEAPRLTSDGS